MRKSLWETRRDEVGAGKRNTRLTRFCLLYDQEETRLNCDDAGKIVQALKDSKDISKDNTRMRSSRSAFDSVCY